MYLGRGYEKDVSICIAKNTIVISHGLFGLSVSVVVVTINKLDFE